MSATTTLASTYSRRRRRNTTFACVVALLLQTWTPLCVFGQDLVAPKAVGCSVFTTAVGTTTLTTGIIEGTLEEGGFVFSLNNYVLASTLDIISVETSTFYTILLTTPFGSITTWDAALIRISTDDVETITFTLEPGVGSQDAMCLSPVIGITSITSGSRELGATFSPTAHGDFYMDVSVYGSDGKFYHSRYVLSSADELLDIPTVTPELLSASPASSYVRVTPEPTPADNNTTILTTSTPAPSTLVPTSMGGSVVIIEEEPTPLFNNNISDPVLVDNEPSGGFGTDAAVSEVVNVTLPTVKNNTESSLSPIFINDTESIPINDTDMINATTTMGPTTASNNNTNDTMMPSPTPEPPLLASSSSSSSASWPRHEQWSGRSTMYRIGTTLMLILSAQATILLG